MPTRPELVEHALEHLLGVRHRRRIARAHALEDLLQSVVLVADAGLRVLAQGLYEGAVVERDVDDLHLGDAGGRHLLHHRRRDGVEAAGYHRLRRHVDQVVLHHEKAQVLVGVALVRRQRLEVVVELHDLHVGPILTDSSGWPFA